MRCRIFLTKLYLLCVIWTQKNQVSKVAIPAPVDNLLEVEQKELEDMDFQQKQENYQPPKVKMRIFFRSS